MIVELFGSELVIHEELVKESGKEVGEQVEGYLDGDRKSFDLTFSFPDTAQGFILREINRIPYGETRTYSEIADDIDSSAIAVGQACSQNPLPLIIPCHRVVGKNSIGGYQAGEDVKRKLFELEQIDF